jgi:hypothetical protein
MLIAAFAMTALLAVAPADNGSDLLSDQPSSSAAAIGLVPRSPTNDEINAAESGNPEAVEYGNRPALEVGGDVNAQWEAGESGNPDAAHSSNRSHDY